MALINYGAIIQSIRQPDKQGQAAEITLGYDTLQGKVMIVGGVLVQANPSAGYVDDQCFFGCMVGRVTNRIKNARFELEGVVYELEKNDGTKKHHLHGVFNKRVWDSTTENGDTVVFKYQSPDGKRQLVCRSEEFAVVVVDRRRRISRPCGCDGEVYADERSAANYELLRHDDENHADQHDESCLFQSRWRGRRERPNATRVGGCVPQGSGSSVLDQVFTVPANKYLPLDDELIPTGNSFAGASRSWKLAMCLGEIASVENTPFDFRKPTPIGERVTGSFDGYDMMFVVDGEGKRSFGT